MVYIDTTEFSAEVLVFQFKKMGFEECLEGRDGLSFSDCLWKFIPQLRCCIAEGPASNGHKFVAGLRVGLVTVMKSDR